jgi:phosphoglycolate phosphatase
MARRMTDFPFDIVGFDLDGTLLNTAVDITAAINFALAQAERPALTLAAVRPMIGGGSKALLMQALNETGGCAPDEAKRLYKVLLAYYEANIAVETCPFPGMVTALDDLADMGVKLAVVTNKFESLAVRLLTELGLIDRFVTVIGGDTMGPGRAKPAADPIIEMIARCGGGRAAFVGDSVYDTGAARAAGIPSVACAFGFLTGPVEDLSADAVIAGYSELIPTLWGLCATSPINAAPV